MPELAEVAVYAEDLSNYTLNQRVVGVSFLNQNSGGSKIIPRKIKTLLNSIHGCKVSFSSEGKSLHLFLENKVEPIIEIRLGMTGQFHLVRKTNHWKRHYFLSLLLSNGSKIYYADPRRFSRFKIPKKNEFYLAGYDKNLGLFENKAAKIPPGYLTKAKISWLLDFGDRTGVGNYMANEALGLLKLSPFTPCSNVIEAKKILKRCLKIAVKSFNCGGNSFNSGHFGLDGSEGKFYQHCRFYMNPSIKRIVFRGRPIYTNFQKDLAW